jgi:mRNA-degrading endonuclease RelE of RelBE toxin-antitoxin system
VVRYSEQILHRDLKEIGHAALALARQAIEKKLKTAPDQYGDRLRSPLQRLHKLNASHLRFVYPIAPDVREVWILMIGNRRDIWDWDQSEILKRLSELDASR